MSSAEIHPTATVHPGTVLGEGVKVMENAVVGKQPSLSPRSTTKREPLGPAEIGDGTIVSTGAVVFAGSRIGARVILGDQSCVRERVTIGDDVVLGRGSLIENDSTIGAMTKIQANAYITSYSTLEEHVFAGSRIGARVILGDQSCVRERVTIGDDVVLGRGSLVENDTTIGAMTKIQANAYITSYSTLEEHVFIAPCVVTTNDNFMGRTERRHELTKGPTIRRGARIGGGAVLLPRIEVGEEAFVGAGAVVTKDVAPRSVVVGNPARAIREVPDEELLEAQ